MTEVMAGPSVLELEVACHSRSSQRLIYVTTIAGDRKAVYRQCLLNALRNPSFQYLRMHFSPGNVQECEGRANSVRSLLHFQAMWLMGPPFEKRGLIEVEVEGEGST